MPSIFSLIVQGKIPCYKIAETEDFFAFLDINPNAKGHTLCIPKQEVNKIMDLDEKTYMELMAFSRRIGLALEKTIDCNRVGIAVIGLEVPHVHVHLIPIKEMRDMTFSHKVSLTEQEFVELAAAIRENL